MQMRADPVYTTPGDRVSLAEDAIGHVFIERMVHISLFSLQRALRRNLW